MTRKSILLWALAGLIIVVLIWRRASETDSKAPAAAAGRPGSGAVYAQGVVVKPEALIAKLLSSGTILANDEVNVTSEAGGKVVGLYFTEGGRVKKGQLLLQVNDAELQASLAKAENRKKLIEAQEYRQRVLLERQAISQQEYDVIASDLRTAQADIDLIRAQIAKTQVRAPFDGTIGLRQVAVGSYLSPGTFITTLQNLDQVKVEFSIPEKYADRVRNGDRVKLQVRSAPGREFIATVFAIEPKIDPETRSLRMRARTANPRGELIPGAFADVVLEFGRNASALLIPSEAIVPTQDGQQIYVVKGGKAEARKVELGTRQAERIEIEKGLSAGDTVLTTGILQLRPGVEVKVTLPNPRLNP